MSSNVLDDIKSGKNFYSDCLHRATTALFITMIIIVILIGLILYKGFTLPKPYFYATSYDGTITQLLPVPRGTGLVDPENS